MELDKREISALIEAYTAMGSILAGSLEYIDPAELMGIKGKILKVSIHANHFKHVAQTLYQKMEYPPDLEVVDIPGDDGTSVTSSFSPEELAEVDEVVSAHCDHIWELGTGQCKKCGIPKLDWEAGHAERQENKDDSSTRVGPEEDG